MAKKKRTSGKGTKRGLLPKGKSNPNSAGRPKGAC